MRVFSPAFQDEGFSVLRFQQDCEECLSPCARTQAAVRGIAETWGGKHVEHEEPSEARSGVVHSTAIAIHREKKSSPSLCYLVRTGSAQTGKAERTLCAGRGQSVGLSKVVLVSIHERKEAPEVLSPHL